MNNPTPLGLRVALAVSAGGVLVRHPLYRDEARTPIATSPTPKPAIRRFYLRTRRRHRQPPKPLHAVGLLIWNCFARGKFSNLE